MRLTTLIVAIIYLQGCTTMKVIDLAKGIEKGAISGSADVEAIWNDHLQNEFIICMIDHGNFPNKRGDRYMLRIPNNVKENGERVEFEQRTISELKPKGEQHWWSWSLYQDRSNVKVYDISVVVDDYSCIDPKASWNKIRTLKAPMQITYDEALLYRGETIKQMVAMHEPFLIFTTRRKNDPYSIFETVCAFSKEINPCLLLVSKTHIQDRENPQIYYDEILSVDQLIWTSEPKPLWYLTIPFAVVADVVIITTILFVLGSMGPRV